jgi:hypothetical protein
MTSDNVGFWTRCYEKLTDFSVFDAFGIAAAPLAACISRSKSIYRYSLY